MRLKVKTPFIYYVNGCHPTRFEEGEREVPEEAARYALSQRFAQIPDAIDDAAPPAAEEALAPKPARGGRKRG